MHFWQAHHWWWWWSSWRRRCWWSRNERSLESLVLFSLISHIKPTDFINHYSSWTTFLLRCYLKRCFYDMIHIANTYVCVDCIVDWREKRGSMMIYNRRSIVVRKTAPLLLKIISSIIRSATRKIMLHQTIFKMWLTSSTILFPIFRHIIYNSASMRLRQIVYIKTGNMIVDKKKSHFDNSLMQLDLAGGWSDDTYYRNNFPPQNWKARLLLNEISRILKKICIHVMPHKSAAYCGLPPRVFWYYPMQCTRREENQCIMLDIH